jgi:hypothetical protein
MERRCLRTCDLDLGIATPLKVLFAHRVDHIPRSSEVGVEGNRIALLGQFGMRSHLGSTVPQSVQRTWMREGMVTVSPRRSIYDNASALASR